MNSSVVQKIKTAPQDPGIYIFYKNSRPLYIGKASNLKNRLQNYLKIADYKTEALHKEADKLKLIKLRSNIEALISESQLIKSLRPELNVLWKDDKNYFYVAITHDKFPRIYTTHQPTSECIGPFTDGQYIKAVLRLLRKFFPYCACSQPHFRLCLNAQIGNCLGFCCQINDEQLTANNKQLIQKYNKNIKKIKNILIGKDKKFIRQLKDPYELLILDKIWAHQPFLEGFRVQGLGNSQKKNLNPLPHTLTPQRIECYDNSHLSGKEAVGAMTAWRKENGYWQADKNLWRKFRIRGNYTEDDPRMMEEVLNRRFNHPEWPYPDLIIIDGGITQLSAARRALITPNPKIISYAKPQKLVYGWKSAPIPISKVPAELQKLIEVAIGQTHNFVQRYHRQIRQRKFLGYN